MADKRLAVLVPYRDREAHLAEFVPHMRQFLSAQGIPFQIVVVEQADCVPYLMFATLRFRIGRGNRLLE